MAECHPVGFRWVMRAKENGATIIHVDPRFTRTSAVANIHAPIRAGSDIAFLGGIINYILEQQPVLRRVCRQLHERAAIISDDFQDAGELDGLFSGWNAKKGEYEPRSWMYKDVDPEPAGGAREGSGGKRARRSSAIRFRPNTWI